MSTENTETFDAWMARVAKDVKMAEKDPADLEILQEWARTADLVRDVHAPALLKMVQGMLELAKAWEMRADHGIENLNLIHEDFRESIKDDMQDMKDRAGHIRRILDQARKGEVY